MRRCNMTVRYRFLEEKIKQNNYKVGVEIGVQKGATFKHLLNTCKDLELYGVDIWSLKGVRWDGTTSADLQNDTESINYGYYINLRKWIEKTAKGRGHLIRKFSLDGAKDFEDDSLDFIFIDATHTYEQVLEDMHAWIPKVRKGGLICGDDYNKKFPGVEQAVKEYGHPFEVDQPVWWWIK